MSLVNYRPSESPVAQMSVVAGLVASTAQALSLSFQEKSVLLRICQSFGSSVTYDVYRSVDGVVDSEPMVSGVSDAFYLSVVLGQENSILVLSLQADGYYPILLTVSYLYEKDLLFISQVGATGDMKYKMFNSTELSQNLDYTIDLFTAVPDLSIDTLPEVIDFLSGFVTTDNLKQYIADQVDIFEIVQGPGNSTTAVMSQNAVTEELLRKVGVDAVVDTTGNSSNLVMSQASVTEELSKKASLESVTDSISAHNTSSTSHADIRELLNTCVGLPAYDSSSYKITFTTLAGASVEIDLPIEQLALRYNAETESIEFDNADGTTTSIPVSAFVKEYVGSIGDRIQISIDENNAIHATVLKNSIDWDCLSVELQERINDHVTSVDFATKVVRTDIAQSLSLAAQNQALENIGADLMVIDLVNGQATLTDEQEARLLSCKGVILRGTVNAGKEVLTKIYFSDYQEGDQVSFWAVRNNRYILQCIYTKSTKLFRFLTSASFIDPNAVSIKAQTLNATEQAQAWSNLGLDLVVLKFPEGATSVVLTDEEDAKLQAGAAVLLTVDGTNTGVGIYNADNRIFASYNFTTAPEPLYYNLWSYTSALYCSYKKASKTFVYNGSLQLNDTGALRFDRITSLTASKQDMALSNIGLDFVHVDYSLLGTTLTDDQIESVSNSRGIILTNISNYSGPTVFIKGNNSSLGALFFAQDASSVVKQINLNYAQKKLSIANIELHFDAVRYTTQNLTNTQKEQALSNIGLPLVHVDYSLIGSTLDDSTYNKLLTTKGVFLENVPDGNNTPSLYFVGSSDTVTTIFVSEFNARVWFVLTLSHTSKKLSLVSTGYVSDVVRYGVSQDLTDAQKQQARSNIGVQSADELLADDDFIAQLKTKLGIA